MPTPADPLTSRHRQTRVLVGVALGAVLLAGGFINRAITANVTAPCQGRLEQVPLAELTPSERRTEILAGDDLKVDFNLDRKASYVGTHVRWERGGGLQACNELPVAGGSPVRLNVYRDQDTGLFSVHEPYDHDVLAFRKTERAGRMFRSDQVLASRNVSLLVLLGAIGALVTAIFLLIRTIPYVNSMHRWRAATLRPDALIENENGAAIGRLDKLDWRIGPGDVLVNPSAVDSRSAYREMPILTRRDVAPGNHVKWETGTFRRLRDARTLAILATLTTALAVVAHLVN